VSLFFSWTNFWVNKRKAKDREKLMDEVARYFGMPLLAFHSLPTSDQDYLIDQYKKAKGLP
jgi:hypothetical protein